LGRRVRGYNIGKFGVSEKQTFINWNAFCTNIKKIIFLKNDLGLFGKTIKKILGDKEDSSSVGSSGAVEEAIRYTPAPSVAGYDPTLWDPQELGLSTF